MVLLYIILQRSFGTNLLHATNLKGFVFLHRAFSVESLKESAVDSQELNCGLVDVPNRSKCHVTA